MTLATRCSACGTSFRVVQDQLKVSGGWVRCGRCNEVFNAIEGLYEVGSPIAEPARRVPTPAPAPESAPALAPVPAPAGQLQAAPPLAAPEPEPEPAGDETAADTPAPIEPVDERLQAAASAAAPGADTTHAPSSLAPEDVEPLAPSPADDWRPDDWPAREPTPSFLVAAERAERKHRPRSRLLWGAVTLLLLALLGLQTAVAYRDVIVARWPAARPPLEQACGWLGCRIEPLRHMAALSVEASGLQQVGTASVYALSVALRNRSDIDLMMPALDLVLSDPQGRTIARRVLTMAELGRPSRALAAGAETTGQATLSTGGQRVAGYTIEIFYP